MTKNHIIERLENKLQRITSAGECALIEYEEVLKDLNRDLRQRVIASSEYHDRVDRIQVSMRACTILKNCIDGIVQSTY